MTTAEKIAYIRKLMPDISDTELSDDVVAVYLELSEHSILERRYPYGIPDNIEFPARYDLLSCEITAALISKMGGEGEIAHSENGINRTYASSFIPGDMLKSVVPFVGVPK